MSAFAFLQELKKHSKLVSPVAFVMGGCVPRENGEFYCDRGTWEWWWNGSLWTWYPFYVPLGDDAFHYGGAWIS